MARKHSGEQINRRSYNVEMRAIEGEEGVIEGFPLVFNQKTRIRAANMMKLSTQGRLIKPI